MEAFLSYWLSWYVLLSNRKDVLDPYIFPLAILIAKGVWFSLASLCLSSIYTLLDEFMGNVVSVVGRYDAVTYVD